MQKEKPPPERGKAKTNTAKQVIAHVPETSAMAIAVSVAASRTAFCSGCKGNMIEPSFLLQRYRSAMVRQGMLWYNICPALNPYSSPA